MVRTSLPEYLSGVAIRLMIEHITHSLEDSAFSWVGDAIELGTRARVREVVARSTRMR